MPRTAERPDSPPRPLDGVLRLFEDTASAWFTQELLGAVSADLRDPERRRSRAQVGVLAQDGAAALWAAYGHLADAWEALSRDADVAQTVAPLLMAHLEILVHLRAEIDRRADGAPAR